MFDEPPETILSHVSNQAVIVFTLIVRLIVVLLLVVIIVASMF